MVYVSVKVTIARGMTNAQGNTLESTSTHHTDLHSYLPPVRNTKLESWKTPSNLGELDGRACVGSRVGFMCVVPVCGSFMLFLRVVYICGHLWGLCV